MRSPRLVGHVLLGAGLCLALLIAGTASSQQPGNPLHAGGPMVTRTGPLVVRDVVGGSRLRTLEACLDASGPERPQARQP